jgi:hypothetical protein
MHAALEPAYVVKWKHGISHADGYSEDGQLFTRSFFAKEIYERGRRFNVKTRIPFNEGNP